MSKNLGELAARKGVNQTLFEELGIAAMQTGSPSVEKMEELADAFVMGKANVFGAASFYDFLKPENKGKKVYICNGSSCMTADTQPALKEKLLQHYKESEIGEMCCLGRCHENSSFYVAGKNYSGNAINEIDELRTSRAHDNPTKVVKFLLKKRHLAPSHSFTAYLPSNEDCLLIKDVPDIIATGDLHRAEVSNYNNILLIASSCWQSTTPFEEKVGNHPDPCKVPILNLKSREVKIIDFSG